MHKKELKKLPLGVQTFRKIIEGDYLYIDKTKQLYGLLNSGSYFFISRPRRFGKSLLCSTLAEIFKGNRELFKALYIYDKIDWQEHPVLHLDFSSIDYSNPDELIQSLTNWLVSLSSNKAALKRNGIKGLFSIVIKELAQRNKVVVLIDEYDKPIIDYVTDAKKAGANRDILRSFYSALKANDRYLKFVFLTGVSKFSKVSIFSGLNNLQDITMDSRFSTIMGITQGELEFYFKDYIPELAETLSITDKKVLEDIKNWYNGYSWDGRTRLYNPFSLLNLFSSRKFENYWFESGTPTFLIETIREKRASIEDFEAKKVGGAAFESFDVGHIELPSLLFQSGYVTIDKVKVTDRGSIYSLTYPNFEVKDSLLGNIFANFINKDTSSIKPAVFDLVDALKADNLDTFIKIITSLFAGIPYTLHLAKEAYYHSLFYMILSLMGAKIDLEVLTDKGRVDAVLELKDKVFIIEFKLGSAEDALKQIEDRKYYERYVMPGKATCLLGVGGFSEKKVEYRMKTIKDVG